MGDFRFGARSEVNLLGVDLGLVRATRYALDICDVDFAVVEGVRSIDRHRKLYAQGRTEPGPIVTWTQHSKHCDGLAVDLVPINPETGKADWGYSAGFSAIAKSMLIAGDECDVVIRWGRDWDRDGIIGEKGETDSPHFERVRNHNGH